MAEPHKIRIRGPWKYRFENGDEGTVTLPAEWTQTGAGSVTFSRAFNWVAELQANQHVFIVFTEYGGSGPVSVNGTALGQLPGEAISFEITSLLQPRNQLVVQLSFEGVPDDASRGLCGDVCLEIRDTAS